MMFFDFLIRRTSSLLFTPGITSFICVFKSAMSSVLVVIWAELACTLAAAASAAACAVALLPSVGGLMTGCTPPVPSGGDGYGGGWDFDEIVDRSGTWSIKYGRAAEGQIPMWIVDMDFRTAPAVSSALKERLNRDVLGYTSTP